jgi:hypothetical protein
MAAWLGRGAVLFLVAFHAWLFGDRLLAGALAEPLVALRWLAGLVLLSGFGWLRRLDLPLFHGRKALVLWLLVVLLHVHAAWMPPQHDSSWSAARETVATAAVQLVAGLLTATGLALLGRLLARRPAAPRPRHWTMPRLALAGPAATGHCACFCPRPPPVL